MWSNLVCLLCSRLFFVATWTSCWLLKLECEQEPQWAYQYDSSSCLLENVHQRDFIDVERNVFQNFSLVELSNAAFAQFGSNHFEQLPDYVTNLIFSYGNISEVSFLSDTLISLRIFEANTMRFFFAERLNHVLRKLTIRSRSLKELPINLEYVVNLNTLSLSGCSLTFVELKEMQNLTSLSHLDLSDNQIVSLDIDPVSLWPRLRILDIQDNKLRELQRFPEAFPQLWTVSLFGNKWYCDWVSAARKRIWDAWIVVEGNEAECGFRLNNGGLCCEDRVADKMNSKQ